MASELDLTTWTDTRSWVANGTRFAQKTESLDLQFKYGTGTYRNAIRFLANGDLRIFGELVTENGALRSYATFSMTVYNTGTPQDIVSFRSGFSNDEKLRITNNGTVQAATGDTLKLAGKEVRFDAFDGATSRWGAMLFDSGTRTLAITDAGGAARSLKISADDLLFRDNGSSMEWGKLRAYTGGWFGGDISELRSYNSLWLLAQTAGGTYTNLVLQACDVICVLMCDNSFLVQDSNNVVRAKVSGRAKLTLTAPSSDSAELELDSTATSGAKRWALRSEKASTGLGSLKLINLTDGGTPTIEFEPGGSIYAPGYVGVKTVTAAPSDSDGRVGAVAVDTSNKRVWVKVTDSGSNRWWYAALVQP